tara:strand:+ start:1037 stop:1666 length:630 start_codon:yes stop_codon:yes gene_type:complete
MSLNLTNVELSDTFDAWRIKTNSIIGEALSLTTTHPQTVTSNTTYTGTIIASSTINATGAITASAFIGDGSQLTNAGSTVAIDTGNHDLKIAFTGVTAGTMTSANVASNLTFNPSTGTVTATAFSGDGSGLTNAGSTVAVQTSVNVELPVPFTGVTAGTMTTANVNTTMTFNPSTNRFSAAIMKTANLQDSTGRTLVIRDAANTIVWGG